MELLKLFKTHDLRQSIRLMHSSKHKEAINMKTGQQQWFELGLGL